MTKVKELLTARSSKALVSASVGRSPTTLLEHNVEVSSFFVKAQMPQRRPKVQFSDNRPKAYQGMIIE